MWRQRDPTALGPDQLAVASLEVSGYPAVVDAQALLRSDVTAYGPNGPFFGDYLDDFLAHQRPGEILIPLGPYLRQLPRASGGDYAAAVAAALAEPTAYVEAIVAAGGSVQLMVNCATPRWLGSHSYDHDVLTGIDEPGDQPIWACSAPSDLAEWESIVRGVAEHHSDQAASIRFCFGSEPENYFAGTSGAFLDRMAASIRGVRAATNGDRFAVGGPTVVGHLHSELMRATPTLGADDIVTFTSESLDRPLVQLMIEDAGVRGSRIDYVSLHLFSASPVPGATATWVGARADISTWLSDSGFSPGDVEVVLNDFPEWAPYESNDTEYFAAMTLSSLVAMTDHTLRNPGAVRMLQGFLMPWGFRPSGPAKAGFTGVPALTTERGVHKAVFHANELMTKMTGTLIRVTSDDPFINAIAARDDRQLTVLLTNHVPAEYEIDLLYDFWEKSPVLNNDHGGVRIGQFGYTRQQILGDVVRTFYDGVPPEPQTLLDDLFADPSRIDCGDLGWPAEVETWCEALQTFGRRARLKRDAFTAVTLDLSGQASGEMRVREYVVDAEYANPYPDRDSLHARIDAAQSSDTLASELEAISSEYGADSGLVRDEIMDLSDPETPVAVRMRPNAVHLLVLSP